MTATLFTSRLLVDAHFDGDGTLRETCLVHLAGGLGLVETGGAPRALPLAVIRTTMQRYGRALGDDVDLGAAERIRVDDDHAIALLRYHSAVDATGRDWLVWLAPGQPPLAAIATQVTAALRHLLGRTG